MVFEACAKREDHQAAPLRLEKGRENRSRGVLGVSKTTKCVLVQLRHLTNDWQIQVNLPNEASSMCWCLARIETVSHCITASWTCNGIDNLNLAQPPMLTKSFGEISADLGDLDWFLPIRRTELWTLEYLLVREISTVGGRSKLTLFQNWLPSSDLIEICIYFCLFFLTLFHKCWNI